jgi:hypothetical protein
LGSTCSFEESGTLELLATMTAREHPDVIQLSCHGKLKPEPCLLLEDETDNILLSRQEHSPK